MQTEFLLSMPGGSEWILIFILIAYFFFWIKALIEIGNGNYNDQATKIIWFLVVFFGQILGLFIYYVFGRPAKKALI
ncbi:MAG: PLDc N-terminal domain-containing protein [Ginsengibacter sp.]